MMSKEHDLLLQLLELTTVLRGNYDTVYYFFFCYSSLQSLYGLLERESNDSIIAQAFDDLLGRAIKISWSRSASFGSKEGRSAQKVTWKTKIQMAPSTWLGAKTDCDIYILLFLFTAQLLTAPSYTGALKNLLSQRWQYLRAAIACHHLQQLIYLITELKRVIHEP